MKTEIREIYKCDYCNKLYQIKRYCIKHEQRCKMNPENDRPCFGCKYLVNKEVDIDYGYHDTIKANLLYCEKIKRHLYPPQVEHKGNQIEIDENDPMPKKCGFFDNGFGLLEL